MADMTPTSTQPTGQTGGGDSMLSDYLTASQNLTHTELQHSQERQEAMKPVLEAEQKALNAPTPQPPAPIQKPTAPNTPIVDPKDFQKFSMSIVALGLIAGGLSKSHWMNAASAMDGAMKGYLAGSEELAKQKREDFDRSFKAAVEQENQQTKEYLNAISARDRSIKDILAQAEVIATKYGMVDAQDAIRRRDLDSIFKAATTRQDTMTRMQYMKDKMDRGIQDSQVKRIDKLLQDGDIDAKQHDDAVQAIQEGRDPGPLHTVALQGQKLDLAVSQYLQTGQMPSMGMRSGNIRTQIIDAADKRAKDLGLTSDEVVAAWSTRKADIGALTQVARQQALVNGYEQTAQKNIDMVRDMSSKLDRSNYSQFFNTWLQKGRVQTGNPEADAFNAALEETLSEYSKVMGGGYGAGGPTEGAQARAHSLLSGATTPDQLIAVTDTMRAAMKNRTDSIQHEKDALTDRIKSGVKNLNSGGGGQPQVLKFDAQGNPIQ